MSKKQNEKNGKVGKNSEALAKAKKTVKPECFSKFQACKTCQACNFALECFQATDVSKPARTKTKKPVLVGYGDAFFSFCKNLWQDADLKGTCHISDMIKYFEMLDSKKYKVWSIPTFFQGQVRLALTNIHPKISNKFLVVENGMQFRVIPKNQHVGDMLGI